MKTQNTWLPVFTGFYESIFDESDSYIESATQSESEYHEHYPEMVEAGVPFEFFQYNLWDCLNYKKGNQGVAEYLCDGITELESCGIIQSVQFQAVKSPRFYNFETDSIDCVITYDNDKLMKYLRDNKEALQKYIEDKYTSRSGFSSFYPNTLDYWMNEENHNEHEVGSLLNFVLFNEDDEAELTLLSASNCHEGFSNGVEFDGDRMIKLYQNKAA